MIQKLMPYIRLIRLNKPIGIMLLLWPVLWAIWLSTAGMPDLKLLLIFLLGTCTMRSAGCAINDIADRDFDGQVERTKDRPMPNGEISVTQALLTFALLIGVAFFLVIHTNSLTILLALPGAVLAATYPYAKRVSYLPQLHLGITFAWAVPMVYAAHLSTVNNTAWLIFLTTIVWAIIYDTQYAVVDRDDDIKVGIKSTALLFGDDVRIIIISLQVLMLLGLVLIGYSATLPWPFKVGIGGTILVFLYQNYMTRQYSRIAYFKAFKSHNWVGLIIFLGIMFSYH
ncbi:MAG: 4-hydroxybenzoate octaprenyltransferase [Gammaproteobacteria bacterium]